MAGVVSPSMWMFELHDEVHDRRSWCSLNEGLGKVLRYGAYSPDVIERLRWMADVLGPALQGATRARGPIDIKAIVAQMIQMGDEGHNRNRAGTLMLLKEWLPDLITSGLPTRRRRRGGAVRLGQRPLLPQPGDARVQADDRGRERHTGVDAWSPRWPATAPTSASRSSGTGDTWYTGPAQIADGLYLGSYGPDDANPDIGDSAITETAGIGGFAMATAPAIVRFVGGSVPDALATTRRMYDICVG